MAFILHDRVKETSTSTGTGTINLAGAADGFETFVSGIGTGNTTYYCIFGGTEFEVGLGTVTSGAPDTLSRDTVITSSNSDTLVNFSAGEKSVFCTLPASKSIFMDSSDNVGIGTTSPSSKLEVLGQISAPRTSTSGQTRVLTLGGARNGANNSFATIDFQNYDDTGTSTDFVGARISGIEDGADDAGLSFYTATDTTLSEAMRIDSSGNVGIGTTSPSGQLEVAGEIIADDNGSNDGGAVIRAWNSTSAYAMFGTANMALGSEYAVITDGTNTYIGGGAGGSVFIRNGANDSNPQIQVSSSQINMTGVVDFGSNLVLPSNAQIRTVTGNYGNFQVDGGGTVGGYDGLNVNGHTVFMSNGSRAGIYNDTNNEWLLFGDFNGDVSLYYNGSRKLYTTSTGVDINDGYFKFGVYTNEANAARSKATLQITNGTTENLNPPRLQFQQNDDGVAGQTVGVISFWSDEGGTPREEAYITANLASNTSGGADMSFYTRAIGGGSPGVRFKIDDNGYTYFNKTSTSTNVVGMTFSTSDILTIVTYRNNPLIINRTNNDGTLVSIRQNGSQEGTISVSGSTVSYNGFTGTHWSRLEDDSRPTTLLKGTLLESVDEMMDWYQIEYEYPTLNNDTEEYEMILFKEPYFIKEGENIGDTVIYSHKTENTDDNGDYIYEEVEATIVKEGDIKHTKCKISDTVEAKNVYGLFVAWDDDDDLYEDMLVAQVGTYVIRIHGSQTVSKGDLIQSNGDGTGKVQSDDIIRASTVAKVISTNKVEIYEDNSYTVPCTIHC